MDFDWAGTFQVVFQAGSFLIMFFSLIGLFIPIFPGIVIIWLVGLVTIIMSGPGVSGWLIILFLTILAIGGMVIDNIVMGKAVRDKGAAWTSIGMALLGGLVGTLVFPPLGGLAIAPLVLFFMEYRRLGNREQAIQVLQALAIGWGWGAVARFAVGFVMVLTWLFWITFNTVTV